MFLCTEKRLDSNFCNQRRSPLGLSPCDIKSFSVKAKEGSNRAKLEKTTKQLILTICLIDSGKRLTLISSLSGFLMDSFANDMKNFDDESSEEEYDVDGILPDPSYLLNNNSHNSSSPMSIHHNNNNNYYSHNKRDKSSSSSRENHKRNKTHAAMVHHEDRHHQTRKVRMASKQQQQQQHYCEDRSNRRKKKSASKRRPHDGSYDEEAEAHFGGIDELDLNYPPPRLSDFDEMFQRAASNRVRRAKGHIEPDDMLEMDPPMMGNPGEQYFLDLAGNIRKVRVIRNEDPIL